MIVRFITSIYDNDMEKLCAIGLSDFVFDRSSYHMLKSPNEPRITVKRDYFLSCSSLLMTGPYLTRLLPEQMDMEIASASDNSSWFAPARTACW